MPVEVKRSDELELRIYYIDDRMDISVNGLVWEQIYVGQAPKTLDLRTQLSGHLNTVHISAHDTQPSFYSMKFEVVRIRNGHEAVVWEKDIPSTNDHGHPPDPFFDQSYEFLLIDG
jgi:hypothetical protein